MDLGQLLINASTSFTLGVQLTLLLAAVFGVWVAGRGLVDLYVIAGGDNRFSNRQPTMAGVFIRLFLGGLLTVLPAVLWVAADTFVAGGDKTSELFNYSAASGENYCDRIRIAVNYLFMLVGAIAWFKAALIVHEDASGGAMAHRSGSPIFYVIGGTLTFFIADVSTILSNTFGMEIGFDQVCTALQ